MYAACRSESNSVFGDHTSPRQDDPAWGEVMEEGLVRRVREYLDAHKADYKLGACLCVPACVRKGLRAVHVPPLCSC